MKYLKSVLPFVIAATLVISCSFIHYTEISEHSNVYGIAIDLEGDRWVVTCEISKPSSDNDFASESECIKGKGYTLYNAFEDASLKSPLILYTDSVQLYLIGESAYRNNSINQYFLEQNVNLRAIAVSVSEKASDILDTDESGLKSVSYANKIKNFCKDQNVTLPDVTEYLKGEEVITVTSDKPQKRRMEFE